MKTPACLLSLALLVSMGAHCHAGVRGLFDLEAPPAPGKSLNSELLKEQDVNVGSQNALHLVLTKDALQFAPIGSSKAKPGLITTYDLYGAVCNAKQLTVFSFPAGKKSKRTLATHTFTADVASCGAWAGATQRMILGLGPEDDLPRRKALVVVNPRAGNGKGEEHFAAVESVLIPAGFEIEKYESTSGKSTKAAVKKIECGSFDYVVAVGGDGTMRKLINTMLGRTDWEECIAKTVFHHVPGGSGNGLATSMLAQSGLQFGVVESAFLLTKAPRKDHAGRIDIMGYEMAEEKNQFGFLSTEWGFAADLDEESEKYRWLGKNRFYVSAILRSLSLRRYEGALSYLPPQSDAAEVRDGDRRVNLLPAIDDDNVPEGWVTRRGSFIMVWACLLPHMASNAFIAPGQKIGAGSASIVILPGDAGRWDVVRMLLGWEDGTHVKNVKKIEVIPARAYRLDPIHAGTDSMPGRIGVDGDFFKAQRVQGQVNHALVRMPYKLA